MDIMGGIHKMLVIIANREDPDQTASSEAVWSGSELFVTAFLAGNYNQNFKTLTMYVENGTVHEILVLVAFPQKRLINVLAYVSSGARGLNFGLSLHLHPYFVCASSKCSGKYVHLRRLAWAFIAHWCDWLIYCMNILNIYYVQ